MSKGFIQIILLIFGAIIQGMAMAQFLFPHNIPSGGGAGIAILIHHFLHLPLGFSLWLSNAVFLIFALNFFGLTWTLKTIFAVAHFCRYRFGGDFLWNRSWNFNSSWCF